MKAAVKDNGMNTREQEITAFLQGCGAAAAQREAIPGDASFRRYERLHFPDGTRRILMNAPPQHEDVRPFVSILTILHGYGYSAPELFAQDEEKGFLLLEDLGDSIYSRVLAKGACPEQALYAEAVALIADMTRKPVPAGVAPYSDALFERELKLLTEWYVPHMPVTLPERALTEFMQPWKALLDKARRVPEILVLRDYHADNLLWLEERRGIRRVGLLDFQDAVIGPVTYDLVSLLEDARRDVPRALAEAMLDHYLALTPGLHRQDFMESYAIMGAQRNIKIIGIFTRLAFRDGKEHYLNLIPRVWGHLEHDLQAPVLAPVAAWFAEHLPPGIRKERPKRK